MSDHLQLRYSLHERTPNGYQWTWRAEGLKDSLLDDFYHRIQMPVDANTIRPEHLRCGIVKFAQVHGSRVDEHVVLYRFYDGGSDQGRPRGVTMLAAWTPPDQFPAPPAANGILQLFRNSTFEYVSDKAQMTGIEQPFSLIVDEPLPATADAPSKDLAEFLGGLTDEDHDYSLTIRNEIHAVQKTPSAAFIYREAEADKRRREVAQHKADQLKQEAKRQADERKRNAEEDQKLKSKNDQIEKVERRQKRKSKMLRTLKVITIIMMVGTLIICPIWYSRSAPPRLSPDAQKVVDLFNKLPRPDQQQVLDRLKLNDQSILIEQTRGPLPTVQNGNADPADPSALPPKDNHKTWRGGTQEPRK